MTDYGVSPPQAPFVTVDTALIIEFDVFMTKGRLRPLSGGGGPFGDVIRHV